MAICSDGRELATQRPSTTNHLISRPLDNTTAVAKPPQISISPPCETRGCPAPAVASHVVAPNSAQQRLCARCWRQHRAREAAEGARKALDALFVSRLRIQRSGGTVAPLLTGPVQFFAEGRVAA